MHPLHIFRSQRLLPCLLALLCLCGFHALPAQTFGEWNIYNATPECTQMQLFGSRLFVVNTSALSSIDLSLDPDSQLSYSRRTGLSGSSVQYICTSAEAQRLAITYADGTIDLMDQEGDIKCIPDLANKPMSGDKTILSLRECHGQLFASGGFGMLVIDMHEGMILQHYATSYPVLFSFAFEGNLYRYSELRGLEVLEAGRNGSDPACWQRLSDVPPLRDALVFTAPDGEDYCLAATQQGELLSIAEGHARVLDRQLDCRHLYPLHSHVMLQGKQLSLYDPLTDTHTRNGYSPYKDCADYAAANDSSCYMLHPYYGVFLTRYTDFVPGHTLSFESDYENGSQPNGIVTSYLGEMRRSPDGVMGISRRSYTSGYAAANALSGVITRIDTEHDAIHNRISRQVMQQLPEGVNFQALQGFDIDPTNPDRYAVCSGLYGLYLFEGDSLTQCYYGPNSVGQVDAFDPTFTSTRISSVAYDEDGNLFIGNSMQDTTLRCLTTEGRWLKFPNAGLANVADARRILISRHNSYGLKWVLNDYPYQKSRVGIYYDGGTLLTQSDDQTAYFSTLLDQDYNEYVPNYIFDLCEDLDGKVWVLTSNGPFVIEDPKATFEYARSNPGIGKVRRVKIPRNDGTNLADYLMESTSCSCMVIDNFNRKWIGTRDAGLYLMSADCITELEHFSTDNSPLLSNSILSLCYDQSSGLLYVSCEGGVLTYQTDAIEGAADFSSLYCYPNPVRPEFSGELRIMGLMNDSWVSITTVDGDLLYRTRSQGATATWDLRLVDGSRVAPGIYLIHGVDSQSESGRVIRFLVL